MRLIGEPVLAKYMQALFSGRRFLTPDFHANGNPILQIARCVQMGRDLGCYRQTRVF